MQMHMHVTGPGAGAGEGEGEGGGDHPRDQPGKYLYYGGTFYMYF